MEPPSTFFTNLTKISVDQKHNAIYQFVIETTPEIPHDSAGLYRCIYRAVNKQLREKIKDMIASGTMIWGFQNLSKVAVFQAELK